MKPTFSLYVNGDLVGVFKTLRITQKIREMPTENGGVLNTPTDHYSVELSNVKEGDE